MRLESCRSSDTEELRSLVRLAAVGLNCEILYQIAQRWEAEATLFLTLALGQTLAVLFGKRN